MPLMLSAIITPEEIGLPAAGNPVVAHELIEICKEVVVAYGPSLVASGLPPDEQRIVLSTLSGVEYFLRRRAKEKVN